MIFAFGSQHIGLTIGPRIGKICADMVMGRRSNVDLAPYAPGRFDKAGENTTALTQQKGTQNVLMQQQKQGKIQPCTTRYARVQG